jgi:hypothetical protein
MTAPVGLLPVASPPTLEFSDHPPAMLAPPFACRGRFVLHSRSAPATRLGVTSGGVDGSQYTE